MPCCCQRYYSTKESVSGTRNSLSQGYGTVLDAETASLSALSIQLSWYKLALSSCLLRAAKPNYSLFLLLHGWHYYHLPRSSITRTKNRRGRRQACSLMEADTAPHSPCSLCQCCQLYSGVKNFPHPFSLCRYSAAVGSW